MCRKMIYLISFVLLLGLTSSFSVASAAGLVNRYSFIDGDTVAVDSVSGRNGTLRGTATISGNRLVLPGGTSDVNLPANILDPGLVSVTIESWFQQNATSNWQRLFDFGQTSGTAGGNCLFYTSASGSNDSRFVIGTNGVPSWQTGEQMVIGPRVAANTPTHVVCVYDGAFPQLRLYQNGALLGTTPVTAPHNLSKVARMFAYIGASVYPVDPHLNGSVDEFRIYDKALTDANVLANFNAGPEPERASNPKPAYGETIQIQDVTLSWKPGAYAVKHDVYLGTNLNTVHDANRSNPLDVLVSQNREPNNYPVSGLIRGKTYYWRIDEVNSPTIWKGNIWKFTVKPIKAWDPDPNGVEYVFTDPNLSWNIGYGSTKSKVWFGTSPGSLVLQTTITHTTGVERYSYLKTGLNTNQFYYWRVDQVQSSGPDVTGDVWQFKTGPSSDSTLVGWWTFDEGEGSTAFDLSGRRNHGTLINGPQWVTGHVKGALQFDGANDYVSLPIGSLISSLTSTTIATWVNFTNTGGTWQRIFDFGNDQTVYMFLSPRIDAAGVMRFAITSGSGESLLDAPSTLATGWHHVAVVINGSNSTMQLYLDGTVVASGTTATLPSALGNTTNNWLGRSQFVADAYFSGTLDDFRIYNRAMTQDEIIKIGSLLEAYLPYPADGATDVEPKPTLNWRPGVKAVKHDVYFSSSFDDVNSATTASPPTIYKGRQDPNKFDITTELKWGQTYYWRIDEVNDPNIWPGSVWSFTTRNYVVLDNFESYTNSDPNIIFKIWKDGVGYSPGNGTGSQVGYRDPNYAELTIFHGGAQSMPVDYNNTKTPYYSEAIRTFDTPQNWTVSGSSSLKALSLWFRGYPAYVGSFTENPAGTYTINASGADIWDVPDLRHPSRFHDEFHYAYKEVTAADEEEGLVTIVARVDSITNTDVWAKAAVMIRDSLDPNSTHGIMCVTPTSGVAFQRRLETGGASASDATAGITAPRWVKLVFDPVFGNLRAYHSLTGNSDDWTQIGGTVQFVDEELNPTMTLPLYVGLAVTSHNASATCTAVFSNVTMIGTGAEGAWKHQDIGIKSNIASPLYVTLQDSNLNTAKVTYTDADGDHDANAVLNTAWQQWDIALSDFAGVDPTKIKKMTIGVGSGSADGTGTIYVDDIRLYVPRCMPDQLRSAADFTGSDCTVDYQDLAILTDNWTISNWLVTPPVGWNPDSDPNLAAYYAFEGNFNDTSGKGYNGEPNGATTVADAVRGGQVANFDGSNDYVVLTNLGSLIGSLNSTTVATWVNFSNTGGDWQRIFDFGTSTTAGYMFLTPRLGATGVMRFAITKTGNETGAESIIDAPSTLATGWHHVAVVINGVSRTMQLYLDGNAVVYGGQSTQTLPSDLGNTTQNWLGRSQWATDAYFSGRLDDFRIYSRVLSQGEVAYLAGKTTPFNQALYLLLRPADPTIDTNNDGVIDLKDYAGLADTWLEILLWPQ